MLDGLTWRAAAVADEALLYSLFAATAGAQFAPLGFAPQQLQPLLAMQFRARQADYAQRFSNALDMILTLADGTPVGRHLIERRADCYRGIDLAVLPEFQNRGAGSWALQQVQQLAEVEGVPFRLRVVRTNPALRLYERVGFFPVSGDELALEMEWQPTSAIAVKQQVQKPRVAVSNDDSVDRHEVVDKMVSFLRTIGLQVQFGPVPTDSFLPGIQLVGGGLRVSAEALLFPGDLLHEAGHLAVMSPARRAVEFPGTDNVDTAAAEEMASLAWSYAAALECGVPPAVVFHADGYRGQGAQLAEGYRTGNGVGLPMLIWLGLTTQSLYPRMEQWLRTREDVEPEGAEAVQELSHAG